MKGNTFSHIFISVGITTQLIAWLITDTSLLSLISGILGIFAVVYCSERRMIQFVFAFGQMITYTWIAYNEKLYGEVGINVFYFIATLTALVTWSRNSKGNFVQTKQLPLENSVLIAILASINTYLLYAFLNSTDDSQPLMDSITTVPAIVAQILLILRYREQWIYWLIIDVASIVMWAIAGDTCMVMQYVFWTANCCYGFYLWSQESNTRYTQN